jgi:hypothetical protein
MRHASRQRRLERRHSGLRELHGGPLDLCHCDGVLDYEDQYHKQQNSGPSYTYGMLDCDNSFGSRQCAEYLVVRFDQCLTVCRHA